MWNIFMYLMIGSHKVFTETLLNISKMLDATIFITKFLWIS